VLFQYLGPGMMKSVLTLRTGNAWVHALGYHAVAPHVIVDTPPAFELKGTVTPVTVLCLRTADIGRISLTRHWRRTFLRDVELIAAERNRGLGTAMIRAVLALERTEGREVELLVLKCNPAQRLYARLGFRIVADDGERLTMRTESRAADGAL